MLRRLCVLGTNDARCRVCREPQATVIETFVPTLMKTGGCFTRCNTCMKLISSNDCERHRAWCPGHHFLCPCTSCNRCFTASQLARHVTEHVQVPKLVKKDDGAYHIVMGLCRVGDTLVMTAGDTTVVFTNTSMPPRRITSLHELLFSASSVVNLTFRAYYGSSRSRRCMPPSSR